VNNSGSRLGWSRDTLNVLNTLNKKHVEAVANVDGGAIDGKEKQKSFFANSP